MDQSSLNNLFEKALKSLLKVSTFGLATLSLSKMSSTHLPTNTARHVDSSKTFIETSDEPPKSRGEQGPSIPTSTYAGVQVVNQKMMITEGTRTKSTPEHLQFPSASEKELLIWLEREAQERILQFIGIALEEGQWSPEIISKLWLEQDIVPFLTNRVDGKLLEEALEKFNQNDLVHLNITQENEVVPSEIVTLEDYRSTTTQEDFARVQKLSKAFAGKRLIFINATPQGGGVALMRHALIRAFRLLNVDARWYILKPDQSVFNITKACFHNVLQAVAQPDVILTDEDMTLYNAWIKENVSFLEAAYKQADVVVIDDPQPCGLIPYIKQANPAAKIIYRSHIQIVGSLASQPGTPQHHTWNFLWENIQQADLFISHPMKMFIPDNVPADKILYMPATTDPLDGLNKPLSEHQMEVYMQIFNKMLVENGQLPLAGNRDYIIQVARFDPSKGIPHVLEAYRQLRKILEADGRPVPQLIITGNGSIDDPDGVPIYNQIMDTLASEPFVHFADDIKVLRLPHRDQILNVLLRKSKVVLQLSTKEGFEVKVTEALMKGRPMIAYRVGGIPLQIQEGANGYLVEVGEIDEVARHLYNLCTNDELYQSMSVAAVEQADKDYLTIPNAICWLYLSLQLIEEKPLPGHYHWVKALANQEP